MGLSKRIAKKQEKKAFVGQGVHAMRANNQELQRRLDNALNEVETLRDRLEFFSADGRGDMQTANEIAGHMMLNKSGIEFRDMMRRIHAMCPINLTAVSDREHMGWSLGEENEYLTLCRMAREHLKPEATHES